jgi:hypothetical protein
MVAAVNNNRPLSRRVRDNRKVYEKTTENKGNWQLVAERLIRGLKWTMSGVCGVYRLFVACLKVREVKREEEVAKKKEKSRNIPVVKLNRGICFVGPCKLYTQLQREEQVKCRVRKVSTVIKKR